MNKLVSRLKKHSLQKAQVIKVISVFLAFNILLEAIAPLSLFAISGGPTQPETQGFEPIGTTQMVDPFTGDFTYNIPLMDVDGYPINISYHSGVSMDQEASWVGLGWSLTPGSINRGMRGIPDDFNGEKVVREIHMKDNITVGITVSKSKELFGYKVKAKSNKLDTSFFNKTPKSSIGLFYNNYTGMGCEFGLGVSKSGLNGSKGPTTYSLGGNISLNSDNGVVLQPNLSYNFRLKNSEKTQISLPSHFGCSYNTMAGLKSVSLGASLSASVKINKTNYGTGAIFGASYDFGMPTYTPQVNYPMVNESASLSVQIGSEKLGIHKNLNIIGSYSRQSLEKNTIETPAFGYLNSENATEESMHDINREKEGTYNTITVALPITNYTFDVFSVTGQGVQGSYRPFRSERGHVFDPNMRSSSNSYPIGLEFGAGSTFKGGFDFEATKDINSSGRWKNSNEAADKMSFRASGNYPLYEKIYFKEASEKSVDSDPSFVSNSGGYDPVRVKLRQGFDACFSDMTQYAIKSENILVNQNSKEFELTDVNYRLKREKRNQSISILTRDEIDKGLGLSAANPNSLTVSDNNRSTAAKGYHIGEITALNTNGSRYVYGIAAYNTYQEEATFSVDQNNNGSALTGNVSYSPEIDNSIGNKKGRDNYFSNTKMPAYAHSYLLTAVLSPDYIDNDAIKGPSDGDMGGYTKFSYTKLANNYNWRTPMGQNSASYQEGLRSIKYDDKASYVYGSKELHYLDQIETKNYIAVFTLENRKDGYGVKDRNGEIGDNPMKLLRKITLYSKQDFKKNGANAIPVKEVHFVYDYSLCPGIPNNKGEAGTALEPNQGGKLTLKSIYFTYGKSKKAQLSPYKFNYSNVNPSFNGKNSDRWGNYKPSASNVGFKASDNLPNSEYPYVNQDSADANRNAKAWLLTQIGLPSGGIINVEYEADDYAYVQNKRAMQMYKISGMTNKDSSYVASDEIIKAEMHSGNIDLKFKLASGSGNQLINDMSKYKEGVNQVYFRCLMKMRKGNVGNTEDDYEYVSGYGYLKRIGLSDNPGYGVLTLRNVSLKKDDKDGDDDNIGEKYCPIIKAAVQYGRLNLSKEVNNRGFDDVDDNNIGLQLVNSLVNAIGSLDALLINPNKVLFWEGIGDRMVLNKSWIRLNNVTGHKYGGGSRVKRICISDEWDQMTNQDGASSATGQEYSYTNGDGTSSGVASYEPQIGGDENPLKLPVPCLNSKGKDMTTFLAPDEDHYVETPFGESFYPSPSVGYSRVTVKNIYKDKTGSFQFSKTGSIVHEFYTAKDFPTISNKTNIDTKRAKSNPFSIRSILKMDVKDFCTVSQGYVIELNDMHGKPKKQSVYQEGNALISSVEYKYKSDPYDGDSRLNNYTKVINKDGSIQNNATIGVTSDIVSDMREENSKSKTWGAQFNLDFQALVPAITLWPVYRSEKTQFRSAVVTKVVQRFGILETTTAKDLGSEVSTSNLAYDAETGEVLVTQTTTNFNDNVYSMTFPAYWHYDGMGAAYQNIGYAKTGVSFVNGLANISDAQQLFVEGDELAITKNNGEVMKGWVSQVMLGRIQVINKSGSNIEDMSNVTLKILRSGRRNQQSAPMATITSLSNPLANIQGNFYEKVLQASAIEYSNNWKTFCDCFAPSKHDDPYAFIQYLNSYTNNPFVMGTKGMYKPNRSFLHLSERTQSNYNNNTNIRKDGVFTSFSPYYKLSSGNWTIDPRNWTFTSEVTLFSPFGAELENRDALGHYSAALFGYNQSLATAVAANAKYREVGVDNFEDYGFSRCADNHFKFDKQQPVNIVEGVSHTGTRSIKVNKDNPIVMNKQLVLCNECDTSGVVSNNLNFVNYKVTGGTAPYTISWTTSQNDVDISLGADRSSVFIEKNPTLSYDVMVTVVDRNGCKYTKGFKFVNGVFQGSYMWDYFYNRH